MNAEAVRHLAAACRAAGSVLVQISTDYVFGGPGPRQVPYREADLPDPRCVYARTKLDGERYAAASPRHYLIRTCGLFGCSPRGTILSKPSCAAHGGPSPPRGLRSSLHAQLCRLRHPGRSVPAHPRSLRHVPRGQFRVHDLVRVRAILRQAGVATPVEPITTERSAPLLRRPVYSVLDTAKYHALGGPPMPPWNVALAEYLAERARPEAED